MIRRSVKKTKKNNRKSFSPIIISLGIIGIFSMTFLYIWQREKVREMLIEEQCLRADEKRLSAENSELELSIANLCSIDNLKNSISDPGFGFPDPNRIKHLHWPEYDNRENKRLLDKTADYVLNFFKENLDVNPKTYADSLSKTD
jgi:hypothetical protein